MMPIHYAVYFSWNANTSEEVGQFTDSSQCLPRILNICHTILHYGTLTIYYGLYTYIHFIYL